jgi:hypothetical protein
MRCGECLMAPHEFSISIEEFGDDRGKVVDRVLGQE